MSREHSMEVRIHLFNILTALKLCRYKQDACEMAVVIF